MLRWREASIDPHDYLKRRGAAHRQTWALLKRGFCIAYAQSNLENDFNLVATYYMTERRRIAAKAKR